MSPDAQDANEWHWLWEVYVVGLCVAAIVAVALLNHRFPGSVPVAAAALSAIVLAVLAFGRWAARLPELDWRRIVFVGLVIGLWVLGMVASPVAVAAIPAIYPLVFMSLPLSIALVERLRSTSCRWRSCCSARVRTRRISLWPLPLPSSVWSPRR
jgi:hypothetical protein